MAPAGVDEAWERLVDVVKEEAKKYYSRDGRSESEDTKRMKEQRRELLRLRAEKRQELSHEKYEEVCKQLRELDKVIKGRKKEYEERVREAAGHQVAEDWRSRRCLVSTEVFADWRIKDWAEAEEAERGPRKTI